MRLFALGGSFNLKARTVVRNYSGDSKTTTSSVTGNLVSAPGIRQNVMLAASRLNAFRLVMFDFLGVRT